MLCNFWWQTIQPYAFFKRFYNVPLRIHPVSSFTVLMLHVYFWLVCVWLMDSCFRCIVGEADQINTQAVSGDSAGLLQSVCCSLYLYWKIRKKLLQRREKAFFLSLLYSVTQVTHMTSVPSIPNLLLLASTLNFVLFHLDMVLCSK